MTAMIISLLFKTMLLEIDTQNDESLLPRTCSFFQHQVVHFYYILCACRRQSLFFVFIFFVLFAIMHHAYSYPTTIKECLTRGLSCRIWSEKKKRFKTVMDPLTNSLSATLHCTKWKYALRFPKGKKEMSFCCRVVLHFYELFWVMRWMHSGSPLAFFFLTVFF